MMLSTTGRDVDVGVSVGSGVGVNVRVGMGVYVSGTEVWVNVSVPCGDDMKGMPVGESPASGEGEAGVCPVRLHAMLVAINKAGRNIFFMSRLY